MALLTKDSDFRDRDMAEKRTPSQMFGGGSRGAGNQRNRRRQPPAARLPYQRPTDDLGRPKSVLNMTIPETLAHLRGYGEPIPAAAATPPMQLVAPANPRQQQMQLSAPANSRPQMQLSAPANSRPQLPPAPQPGAFMPPKLKLPPARQGGAQIPASTYDLTKMPARSAVPVPPAGAPQMPAARPTPAQIPASAYDLTKMPARSAVPVPSAGAPQMMPDIRAAQTAANEMADIRATVDSMRDYVNNPPPNPEVKKFYADLQEGYVNMPGGNSTLYDANAPGAAMNAPPLPGVNEDLQRKLNNVGRVGLSDARSRAVTNPGSYSLLVEDHLDKIETPLERSERIYQERDARRRQANVAAGRAPDQDKVTFGAVADADGNGGISPQEQRDADLRMRDRRAERFGFPTTPQDKAAAFQSARDARLQRSADALALRREANAIRGPQMSLAQGANIARGNMRRRDMEDAAIVESRRRFDVGAEEAQQRLRNERRNDRRRSGILQGELDRKIAADSEAARQFDERMDYDRRNDRRNRRQGREAGDLDREIKQYEFDRLKMEDEREDKERIGMGTPEKMYQTQAQARAAGLEPDSPEYIATAIDGAYLDIEGPVTPGKLEEYMAQRGVPPAVLRAYITGAGSFNDYTGRWDRNMPEWLGGESQVDIDRQAKLQRLYGVE